MVFVGGGTRATTSEVPESFVAEFRVIAPHLDERQRRLLLAARAMSLGQGGARRVAQAVGVHPRTVTKGIAELHGGDGHTGNLRRPGGGRKSLTETDPDVLPALLRLMKPNADDRPQLQWTSLSTRAIAAELQGRGHRISAWSVAKLLRQNGFRLSSGPRAAPRDGRPDRGEQYRRVNDYVGRWRAARLPVLAVSVARERHDPEAGALDPSIPLSAGASPIIDVNDLGSADATVALAMSAIRAWWDQQPVTHAQLLLVADVTVWASGSRAWRRAVTRLAADTGLTISVCYLPPITMRWVRVAELIRSTVMVQRAGCACASHKVELRVMAGTGAVATPMAPPDGPPAWNYTVSRG